MMSMFSQAASHAEVPWRRTAMNVRQRMLERTPAFVSLYLIRQLLANHLQLEDAITSKLT